MQENNPYAAPSANLRGNDTFTQSEGVSQGVVKELTGTRGWTQFIGVLSIIVGIIATFAIVLGASYALVPLERVMPGIASGFMAVVVVFIGMIFAYGFMLIGFSSAVQRLIYSGKGNDLADAMRRQRNFWIFWGVVTLIGFVFSLYQMIA